MIEPRDYQADAIVRVEAALARSGSALLVSPTGSGKGSMGVLLAQRAAQRNASVLWLAHRRELIADTSQRLVKLGLSDHGVLLAGAPRGNANAPLQIASVQTLLFCEERPRADIIVFDEAHHVAAPSYRSIRQAYPGAAIVGLTATPQRSDGVGLHDAFAELIVAALPSDLTRRGYLVPCDVIAPARCVGNLALDPKDAIQQYAGERRTIVFCVDVRHAHKVAYDTGGVCIEGKLKPKKRAAALEAFARGELRVLTNVFCLTEGWDCPEAEVCVLARGCTSTAAYLQMVGRVLRPSPGKERATLIDLYGVVHKHGLPNDDREYSLTGRPICASKETLPTLSRCANCWAVFRRERMCPRCGAELPPPELPKVALAPLFVTKRVITQEEKQRYFDYLCKEARRKEYREGWVGFRFRARFGHWPQGFTETIRRRSDEQAR